MHSTLKLRLVVIAASLIIIFLPKYTELGMTGYVMFRKHVIGRREVELFDILRLKKYI